MKEGDETKEEKGIRDACRNLWVPKSSSGDLREGNEGSLSRQLGRCVDNFWTFVALKRVAFGDRGKGKGRRSGTGGQERAAARDAGIVTSRPA